MCVARPDPREQFSGSRPLKTVPIRRRSHQRRSGVDPAAVCGRVRGNFLNEARNYTAEIG